MGAELGEGSAAVPSLNLPKPPRRSASSRGTDVRLPPYIAVSV